MQAQYNDIKEFIDDLHKEVSIYQTVIDMGLVRKDDFKGNFTNCIFHDGDRTPSLQITDNFWKCYGCGAKGDLISFVKLYYSMDFYEAVKKIANFLNVDLNSVHYKVDARYEKLRKEWEVYLENFKNADKEIRDLQRDYFPQEIGFDPKKNYVVFPITSKSGAVLGFTKRRIDFIHERLGLKNEDGEFRAPKWKVALHAESVDRNSCT